MATRVLLVRHGESVGNAAQQVIGQLDVPLTARGRHQAVRLADRLMSESIDAIYCSSLQRSIDTAQPIAERLGRMATPMVAFRERHLGIMQGRFRDERDPEVLRWWEMMQRDGVDGRPPDGESMADVLARVAPAVMACCAEHRDTTILIVGHRHVNRALLAALKHWPLEVACEWKPSAKRIWDVVLEDDQPVGQLCVDHRESVADGLPEGDV